MNNRTSKRGWHGVKFGDEERYVSLEHLELGEFRIGCIRISVQSSQLPLHCRLAALAKYKTKEGAKTSLGSLHHI